MKNINILILLISLFSTVNYSQLKTLDDFENNQGWKEFLSDGVTLKISSDQGLHGNAIRFDYDFTKGTGYGGINKVFKIDLPENFEFSFYMKAESPGNNFEIKFLDSTGSNVWWVNNRNYEFPKDWKKIRLKKRHIGFAWGPTEDRTFRKVNKIEFTIASYMGGKGTVWIDDLKFEQLPPEVSVYPEPSISANSFKENCSPLNVFDKNENTFWQSKGTSDQSLTIDFKIRREFGGLKIDWLKNHQAKSFDVLIS